MLRAIGLSLGVTATLAVLAGGPANGQSRDSVTTVAKPSITGGKAAQGLPPSKPRRRNAIMNELVESPVANLNYGDADSAGFFQMRQGVLLRGAAASKQVRPPASSSLVVSPRVAVPTVRVR